jgi:hypothetical protein
MRRAPNSGRQIGLAYVNPVANSLHTSFFVHSLARAPYVASRPGLPSVKKRQDVVHAKGKGAIETYWLVSTSKKTVAYPEKSIETSVASSETDEKTLGSESCMENVPDMTVDNNANRKEQRLVDWNCELLLPMLKKIVARRRVKNKRRTAPSAHQNERIRKREAAITNKRNLLGELVEVIPLPPFDAMGAKAELDFESIDLGENIASELRAFISLIASMYRDENPFHNWEHASHVTMSVYKLLARIVAADSVLDMHKDAVESPSDVAGLVHEYTYGIASDPLAQFAVVLSALIHDVDHRGELEFRARSVRVHILHHLTFGAFYS